MRCGITRVLNADEEPDNICSAVIEETKRILSRTQHATVKEFESRVIGFYSPKAGTGVTTAAINAAAALSLKGKKTAVIDMNPQFGDVAGYLNINKGESISDLALEQSITPATVRSYLCSTDCGVRAIVASSNPEEGQRLSESVAESIVSMLRADFDYVILDLPSGMDSFVRTAISLCDTVYMVVNPELQVLRNAKTCMSMLSRYALADRQTL